MKISIIGPSFDAWGYAQALRSIAFGLLDKGYTVRIIPRDWSQLECGYLIHKNNVFFLFVERNVLPEGPILQINIAQEFNIIPGKKNWVNDA
ncbi:hypothetical protein M3699_15145 [Peribacillus simplex]|uniref:hypothetical protein n=1 Tax=Peribacillus simplex TaxID=1478 RepID=UPI0020412E46|nr:hypothetical protein [Peribacillus simplex]MCM3675179.1 hypothetical protein [Peribacillus simplex]